MSFYFISPELYPTNLRVLALGMSSAIGAIVKKFFTCACPLFETLSQDF